MKIKTLLLAVCTLIIYSNCEAQKYPFEIPKGTLLYTTKPHIYNIKPYKRQVLERHGSEKTKIIETGDFLFQEKQNGDQITIDTIGFEERTIKIIGSDSIISKKIMEFQKPTIHLIECNIVFKEDKILVLPSSVYKSEKYQIMTYPDNFIHRNDQNLYFKLDTNSDFSFYKQSFSAGVITSPFRIRLSSPQEDESFDGESRFNNINLLLSYKITNYKYRHGKLKESSNSFGPFIGASLIQLNTENSEIPTDSSINKVGLNAGIAFLKEIKYINVGIAIGVEFIDETNSFNWTYRSKPYLGFLLGVHL